MTLQRDMRTPGPLGIVQPRSGGHVPLMHDAAFLHRDPGGSFPRGGRVLRCPLGGQQVETDSCGVPGDVISGIWAAPANYRDLSHLTGTQVQFSCGDICSELLATSGVTLPNYSVAGMQIIVSRFSSFTP